MKTVGLLFASCLIFVNAAFSQNFNSEGKLRNAAKIPAGILTQLEKTDEVKHCLQSSEEEVKFGAGWFRAATINLNDDGRADYLVKSERSCLYGPRAATWWIFSQGPRGFKLVFNDSVLWLSIERRKTKGYRDISTETTMMNIIRNTWKFNGREYKLMGTKFIEPGK